MGDDGGFVHLRDFIYLDVERVKSLLSQIDKGLLTDRSDAVGSSVGGEARAGISLPFLAEVGGTGKYIQTDQSTENRTLHDYVYNQTEERLLELKRIRRLPGGLDGNGLRDRDVRHELSPVEYVLATGSAVLSDFKFMITLLENFNDLRHVLHRISQSERFVGTTGKARGAALQEIEREAKALSLDDIYVKDLLQFFDLFYKDRIILQLQPFPAAPDVRLAGPLQEPLLRERLDDIRFKFGSAPAAQWTVFGQVAAVPDPPTGGSPPVDLSPSVPAGLNEAFDTLFAGLRAFEQKLQVSYPEIAITPIAVYRD